MRPLKELDEPGLIVEFDEEGFVLRVQGLEQARGRPFTWKHQSFSPMLPLVSIEQSDGERGVFAREMRDLLLGAVFEDAEIGLVEAEHEAVHGVGHGNRNDHEGGVDVDPDVLRAEERKETGTKESKTAPHGLSLILRPGGRARVSVVFLCQLQILAGQMETFAGFGGQTELDLESPVAMCILSMRWLVFAEVDGSAVGVDGQLGAEAGAAFNRGGAAFGVRY